MNVVDGVNGFGKLWVSYVGMWFFLDDLVW